MRAFARETAFKLIFERLFVKENYDFNEEFFASLKKEEDKEFAIEVLTNYLQNKETLTEMIKQNLIGYEIDRVYKIDLALMLEALTEIFYIKTPERIAINEVVELAKKYSTEKSSRFINGVLSAILRKKKAEEQN